MEPPDDDDSTSLLGEALAKLMATEDEQSEDEQSEDEQSEDEQSEDEQSEDEQSEDEQSEDEQSEDEQSEEQESEDEQSEEQESEEPIQSGDTMEFHRYMDLPFHIREKIRKEAIDEEDDLPPLATVSKEWQEDVEDILLDSIRINPSVEEDVLMFKQIFKNERRRHLAFLEIILDDRKTGPWHTANDIVQISLAMEKIGKFFQHLSSWDPDQALDLEIKFVSVDSKIQYFDEDFDDFDDLRHGKFDEGYDRNPSIRTTSLWTKGQLRLLGNSNLASDKPLWATWSEFPKRFGIANWLTFPLDCVPLPASMAIIGTMPNLEHCSFELAFEKMAREGDAQAEEDGMARLADFFEQLPTLAPSLRELKIRVIGNSPVDFDVASANRLSAALRDSSQNLRTLKLDGICMHQNFFESFGEGGDLVSAKLQWNWPNLQDLALGFCTFGPKPGPFSKPDQLSLTPTKLLIAAGRASIAMPLLSKLQIKIYDEGDGWAIERFSVSRALPAGDCKVKLDGFTKNQAQWIVCAWAPFLRAKTRLVSEEVWGTFSCDREYDDDTLRELSTDWIYETIPEEYSPGTTFGAGALVNNASFLEAQRLVRAKSGVDSVLKL